MAEATLQVPNNQNLFCQTLTTASGSSSGSISTGQLNIDTQGPDVNAIKVRSDGSTNVVAINVGRTTNELEIGVVATAGQFFGSTQPGDIAITDINSGSNIYLGIGTTPIAYVNSTALNAIQMNVLTGSSSVPAELTAGRTADELILGVSAANNQFMTGTAAGDVVLQNINAGDSVWIGSGTTPEIHTSTSGGTVHLGMTTLNMATGAGLKYSNFPVGTVAGTTITQNSSSGGIVSFTGQTIASETLAAFVVTNSSITGTNTIKSQLSSINPATVATGTASPSYLGAIQTANTLTFNVYNPSSTTATNSASFTFEYEIIA
jgi:hypothetical protein